MKTAILFEGGGMRGIFTAGVIDYLLEQEIYFDHIYGVSAGAGHGASYAARQHGRAYAVATDYAGEPQFCSMKSLLKTGDLFNADFIYHQLPEKIYPIDNETFLASGTKFTAVCTDCVSGEAVYLPVKDLLKDMDAVRASSSMPIAARMVPIGGRVYLDGGITDSVPLAQARAEGYDRIVVVLTQPHGYRKKKSSGAALLPLIRAKYYRYPRLVEAMARRAEMYNEEMELIEQAEKAGEIFVIAPLGDLGIGRTEMDKKKLYTGYKEGYYVAEGLGEKLRAYLAGVAAE